MTCGSSYVKTLNVSFPLTIQSFNAYKLHCDFFPEPSLLSTSINTETLFSPAPPDSGSLTFSELVEQLNAQTSPPTLEQINSWLANVEISPLDVEPYLGFKEGNYWRHRVCRNDAVEMLICELPTLYVLSTPSGGA